MGCGVELGLWGTCILLSPSLPLLLMLLQFQNQYSNQNINS